jgi:carbon storage regulator
MLVLSRKKNERIVVSQDITIVVVEIRADKVRLGIEAPSHIPVHRGEVFDILHEKHGNGNVPAHGEQVAEKNQVSSSQED